jgi:hypothetical protein
MRVRLNLQVSKEVFSNKANAKEISGFWCQKANSLTLSYVELKSYRKLKVSQWNYFVTLIGRK